MQVPKDAQERVPKPAVAHKMAMEGLDPAALDADREQPSCRLPAPARRRRVPSRSRPPRLKKLHWKAIGTHEIAEDSIWGGSALATMVIGCEP